MQLKFLFHETEEVVKEKTDDSCCCCWKFGQLAQNLINCSNWLVWTCEAATVVMIQSLTHCANAHHCGLLLETDWGSGNEEMAAQRTVGMITDDNFIWLWRFRVTDGGVPHTDALTGVNKVLRGNLTCHPIIHCMTYPAQHHTRTSVVDRWS